jgi:hypothetical protein
MSIPVVCPKNPLPRDLDVIVTISRPVTEIATDMTLAVFLTPDFDVPPNNNRVRYYSSFDSLAADTTPGSAMYFAGQAFFNRQVRPTTLAVGRVCESPVAAGLIAGDIDFASLQGITNGAFDIEVNGALMQVASLDFAGVSTIEGIISLLTPKMSGIAVQKKYGGLILETSTLGDLAALDYAASPTTGTDVSGLLGLTQAAGGQLWQGYTPQGLAAEAALVRLASRCNQKPPYGYIIDAKYRDTPDQKAMADWAESVTPAYFSACTNSITACNAADATNIGWYCNDKGYIRTGTIYHDNPQVYPDMSYLAFALATNYSLPDSAITMKFKQLDGIDPSLLTETQLATLIARRINSYVYIGNTSRTVREGVQALDTWYTDTLVNLDNFREELQVEVYNVFLRTPKAPYTSAGQNKLVSAAAKICRKYTANGVFASRDVEAPELESGYKTMPATTITPVPVAYATTSERAARMAPPIYIVAYEAGAMHKVSIMVDVYN